MIYVAPENQPAFDAMKANLETELAPKGELQLSFFLTILHSTWNARRCIALEAGLQNEAIARGLADAVFDDEFARKLDRLYRYKKMHETTRRQAIADLRKIQTEAFLRNEPKSEFAAATEQQPSILVDTKSAARTRKPKPQPDPVTSAHNFDDEIRALTTYAVRNLKRPPAAA